MKPIIILFLFCLILVSCKQTGNNNAVDTTTSFTKISEVKSFYKQFRGTIGTQPITLNLIKTTSAVDTNTTSFSGYFYYDNQEKPLPVYGITDEKGYLNLDVWSRDGSESFFKGKQNADGIFAGTWSDTVSVKRQSLPFSLHEVYDNHTIRFNYIGFADSSILFKGTKDSPKAMFVESVLTPVALTDKTLTGFLNKSFLTAEVPSYNLLDTTAVKNIPKITYPDAAAKFKAESAAYFKDYFETMKEEKQGADYNLNYNYASLINVFYNTDNLLSIGESVETYTGGAHGMAVTNLNSYDLKTQKKLSLDDIFKPGYQPTVIALLEKAIRLQQNIKDNEPLNSVLFIDKMEVTDNFCVTRKGILFLYNSDEIASHAQGEFQLFIPFTDLKAVLK